MKLSSLREFLKMPTCPSLNPNERVSTSNFGQPQDRLESSSPQELQLVPPPHQVNMTRLFATAGVGAALGVACMMNSLANGSVGSLALMAPGIGAVGLPIMLEMLSHPQQSFQEGRS